MGTYVNENLIGGETVVYEAHLHWKIYVSLKALFTLFLLPIIQKATSEFAITNKRIIIKVGWISRRTVEMNLTKVESVIVNQSIFGRIFNYGSIVIVGTGGTREAFTDISRPLEFRKAFQEQQCQ